jgi:thymidylate synthase (FAD)
MAARLVSATPDGETTMAYVARVSNPAGQAATTADNGARLLRYCLRHGHWSVFEHAHMTVEVTTSLAVAAQLLRHRSFTFQQFSQRYAAVPNGASSSEPQATPETPKAPEPVEAPEGPARPQATPETPSGASAKPTEAPEGPARPQATPEKPFQPVHLRMQHSTNRQASTDDCPAAVQAEFQRRLRAHLVGAQRLYEDMLAAGVARECARFVLPQCTTTRLYMTGNCRSWIHYIESRCAPGTQAEHRAVAAAIRDIFAQVFPVVAAALQ